MAEAVRPLSILISALGGQGGGVLTEWIVAAAAHAGYPAQSTSIPGVAQRTGATTYYLEVFPRRIGPGAVEPTFSLYPMAGDVDVIIASEMLEAGRTLETDYASPDRTTVIASTHRLFAIGEKSALGNGVFPHERLLETARVLAHRLIAVAYVVWGMGWAGVNLGTQNLMLKLAPQDNNVGYIAAAQGLGGVFLAGSILLGGWWLDLMTGSGFSFTLGPWHLNAYHIFFLMSFVGRGSAALWVFSIREPGAHSISRVVRTLRRAAGLRRRRRQAARASAAA